MPELPDIEAYLAALEPRILDQPIESIRIASPFLLRTVEPPLTEFYGRRVRELRRIGKRIGVGVEGDLWLVVHLMVAGRLHWKNASAALRGKHNLAAFDFPGSSLVLTEAGTKRRACLHACEGSQLFLLDPGGIDVLIADLATFRAQLTASNHTVKRALTDPKLFSGIGNAYSDEILHRAKLSPIAQTQKLSSEECRRLFESVQSTLGEWRDKLVAEAAVQFPERVTAFRADMAVHGRFGKVCPTCGATIQRVRYAENEMNYCPVCQTGGRILADRSLSRLLRDDWPKTVEELDS